MMSSVIVLASIPTQGRCMDVSPAASGVRANYFTCPRVDKLHSIEVGEGRYAVQATWPDGTGVDRVWTSAKRFLSRDDAEREIRGPNPPTLTGISAEKRRGEAEWDLNCFYERLPRLRPRSGSILSMPMLTLTFTLHDGKYSSCTTVGSETFQCIIKKTP